MVLNPSRISLPVIDFIKFIFLNFAQSESASHDVSFNASSWMSEGDSHVVSNISTNPEEIALDDDSDDNDDKADDVGSKLKVHFL